MTTKSLLASAVAVGLVVASTVARAQDFKVQSSSGNEVFLSKNTGVESVDRIAVKGVSTPIANYGVGGYFEAAWRGVVGIATYAGTGSRYGGYFAATSGTNNYGIYALAPAAAGSYAGYFAGNVYVSGTLTQASDFKLKTNLQDVQGGMLAQVLRLRPKTYRYNTATTLNLPAGDQVGFVAQDVSQVFPNLVQEVTVPAAEKGRPDEKFLSVDYIKMVPLLVKAVQEQQAQIDALKAQLASRAR